MLEEEIGGMDSEGEHETNMADKVHKNQANRCLKVPRFTFFIFSSNF